MESLSPLLAWHRPVPILPWSNTELFRRSSQAHSHFPTAVSNPVSTSLRERWHKSSSDYLNAKDVWCSPSVTSLAADISQNLRVDGGASPIFPTLRRALFTADLMGGLGGREQFAAPPLPSLSSSPLVELMELSPSPRKAPRAEIEATSPASRSTSADENMLLDSPAPITRQASLEPPKSTISDRGKIVVPRRPSLARVDGFTTNANTARVHSDSQLPVFRYGAGSHFNSSSSSLSLDICFGSVSPPRPLRHHSATSPCATISLGLRFRPQFTSRNRHKHGSSTNSHARRQSNSFLPNRKQFRRSLTMFERIADITKSKQNAEESASTALQSIMDIEEPDHPVLPHFLLEDPADSIPRISQATMLDVLDGKYRDKFDQKIVIDCRFEYEYEGGHIDGAVNYNDKELLAEQLLDTPINGRTLLVFHCEYSVHRAPLVAHHVRSQDRMVNAEFYPKLTYPEVYILDGGYSAFFAAHRGRCFPATYVEMSDAKHKRTCEREMGRLKSRKGVFRAQTFAFDSQEHYV
ncbi:hypothetical protein S40293_10262 [Stachybotrys chartarum IBT 40293]|nr:hypothetical protein S40293_10262 [Stachybotrys chartarum IBT 40293]